MRAFLQSGPAASSAIGERARSALTAVAPALVVGLIPVLFIPTSVDAYVLPRGSLVILAGCGAALFGLWLPGPGRGGLGSLGHAALGVAAAALFATAFSVNPTLSLVGGYGRYESLPMRLAYLLLFCLPVWLRPTPRQRRWPVSAYLAGCTVASLEALQQAYTGSPVRPDGNLGHANLLAALLAMAVPLIIVRARQVPLWSLCLVPVGAALVSTSSRSGWLGAIAGCIALAPLLAQSARMRRLNLGAGLLAVAAIAAAVIASPLGRLHSDTGAARLHVWSDSLAMIAARPLLGWGPDTQGLVLGRYLRGDWEPGATFDRIHQLGLDLLATQGILGLAACSIFWAIWARGCWRAQAALPQRSSDSLELAGLIAAWVAYLAVTALNFDWTAATAPLWLLAGLAWSAAGGGQPQAAGPSARTGSARAAWLAGKLAATAAVLAAAVGLAALPLTADLAYFRGDLISAVHDDPLQYRYHQALGERLAQQHHPAAAAVELERARRLGLSDSSALVLLGDSYAEINRRDRARRAYRQALSLNRFDSTAAERLRAL